MSDCDHDFIVVTGSSSNEPVGLQCAQCGRSWPVGEALPRIFDWEAEKLFASEPPGLGIEPWQAYADQAIAVAGPDVGLVSRRDSLVKRGNQVRDLNGGLLNREMFPDLYALIGERFGGDPDEGTFRLPDLRGRVVEEPRDEP